jgi:hypothetical protein
LGVDIDGEAAGDGSGRSVAMSADGETVIIASPFNDGSGTLAGHARIFDWDGTSWVQRGADIDGDAPFDQSGWSVGMSADGDTVIIGAPFNEGPEGSAGQARIFDWDAASTSWVQRGADIDSEARADQFGISVGITPDGDTVIVGARLNDDNGTSAGHTRIFDWDATSTSWVQRGADIDGEAAGDRSGTSVGISDDGGTVIIGAPENAGAVGTAGHARIFDWDATGTSWVQRGSDIDGDVTFGQTGWSVGMSGDGETVIIGARLNDGNGTSAGNARIFDWDATSTSWVQRGADIDGEAADDQSGTSVGMSTDGDTVIVGAPDNGGNGARAGHARILDWDATSTSWVQRGADIDGEAAGDRSGFSVGMSDDGDTVVIGAPDNGGNGTTAGHARVYRVSVPVACEPGFFSTTGSEPCTPAPAGSFVDTAGATEATLCPVGTFSAESGAVACTQAPAGSFVDTEGAIAATLCPVGTFSAESGAVACTQAPVGSFVDTEGAIAATPCPENTTTEGTGSTSVDACVPDGADSTAEIVAEVSDIVAGLLADPATPEKAIKDLEKAAKALDKALEELEDGDLEKALKEIEKAGKELTKAGKDGADVGAAIDLLVGASQAEAVAAIDAAIAADGDPAKIAKAQEKLAKAEAELAAGKPDKALKEYASAVKEALKAVE